MRDLDTEILSEFTQRWRDEDKAHRRRTRSSVSVHGYHPHEWAIWLPQLQQDANPEQLAGLAFDCLRSLQQTGGQQYEQQRWAQALVRAAIDARQPQIAYNTCQEIMRQRMVKSARARWDDLLAAARDALEAVTGVPASVVPADAGLPEGWAEPHWLDGSRPNAADKAEIFSSLLALECPPITGWPGAISEFALFAYRAIRKRGTYDDLARTYETARAHYSQSWGISKLNRLQSDAAVRAGRWDEAWAYGRTQRVDFEFVRTVRSRCAENSLDSADLNALVPYSSRGLTPAVSEFDTELQTELNRSLRNFEDEFGSNFVDFYCSGQMLWGTARTPALPDLYQEGWLYPVPFERQAQLRRQRSARRPAGDRGSAELLEAAKVFYRLAENAIRARHGFPRVGEGWVSETQLYNALRDALPGVEIVQHARPTWLGLQHLDIYFPEHNIAIEYQGQQHFRPVELFGGKAGFEATKQRDARKRALCRQWGCWLIEVTKESDFDMLVTDLRTRLS